jgi:8-oxo-dGTP diphosphatase
MLHRIKKPNDVHEGKWNGLGGKFEARESPEECMLRELEEESGPQATKYAMKGILSVPQFSHGKDWYIFIFVVEEFIGELIDCMEWELDRIAKEDLLTLNLREGDRQFLPLIFQPGFVSIKAFYEDGKYISTDISRQN